MQTVMDRNEAGVDLVLLQPSLFYYRIINQLVFFFSIINIRKAKRFVSKQAQAAQPHVQSKGSILKWSIEVVDKQDITQACSDTVVVMIILTSLEHIYLVD